MEPDPPSPTGTSPSVAMRAMQQRADDQRSRVRRLPRPHPRPTSTGRQGQTTSILARRMREPAPAADNFRQGEGRNPRAVDIGKAEVYSRGFRRSDRREPSVTRAYRWRPHGEACAGSTLRLAGTRLTRVKWIAIHSPREAPRCSLQSACKQLTVLHSEVRSIRTPLYLQIQWP